MMKMKKWAGGMIALLLALSLCGAGAEEMGTVLTGQLEVRGQAIRTVMPDTVSIAVGVSAENKNEQEALGDANAIIADVIDSLIAMGIPENQIRTSHLDISPRYETTFTKRQLVGYTASISLTIKLMEFDKINTVIDAAVSHGANDIGGMQFSFSEEGLVYRQALMDAIAAAREKADAMAEAAGVQLGTLLSLREGSSSTYSYTNSYTADRDMSSSGEYAKTQVMSGEIQISASVDMTYETK